MVPKNSVKLLNFALRRTDAALFLGRTFSSVLLLVGFDIDIRLTPQKERDQAHQ
jgi:hypothetical protein